MQPQCVNCQKPIPFLQWMTLITPYVACRACGFRNRFKPWMWVIFGGLLAVSLVFGARFGWQTAAQGVVPVSEAVWFMVILAIVSSLFGGLSYMLNPLQEIKVANLQLSINGQLVSHTVQAEQMQQALNRFWYEQSTITLQHPDGRMVHAVHTGPDVATLQVWDATKNEQAYFDVERWRVDAAFISYVAGSTDWDTNLTIAPSQNLFVPTAPRFQIKPWMIIAAVVIILLLLVI